MTLPTDIRHKISLARSVRGDPPSAYRTPYRSVGGLLLNRQDEYGEKPFIIFYDEGGRQSTLTYSAFYGEVCRTSNYLKRKGIRRGDRVATVAHNHTDTVIQYFACWTLGAVVVPINVGEDDKRIGYILSNSDTKLAFVRSEYVHRIEEVLTHVSHPVSLVRVNGATGTPDTVIGSRLPPVQNTASQVYDDYGSSIAKERASLNLDYEVSPEDEALIVYTSGTTGNPKGVVLIHYNLLIDAKAIAEWHGMAPAHRMMCVLPIHHVNGIVVTLLTPLNFGGTVVLNQKFHSSTFFERIAREKVHVVSVVPTLLQFLLHENPDLEPLDLSQFRHIICGAGPLTCELVLRFEDRFGIPVIHGYGLSETTCYSCFLPIDLPAEEHIRWLKDYGFPSIGIPIPPNEMAIHDPSGRELGENVRGEIVIRGHNVMKEYFANPEANETTFAHGWFRSGDEGFYVNDEQGRPFFFITGRIKELIIRGGTNISPFEIDEVLMNIPGVKTGLAVGFDNDWYGEEVGAYVQKAEGSSITADMVIEACRKFFPFAKCPKVVVFGNEIPVTSTGKYQRNRLKPLFEKWKEVQFSESSNKGRMSLT